MRYSVIKILALSAVWLPMSAVALSVNITGIDDKTVFENVRIYSEMIPDEEADGSERHLALIREAVDKAVRAYGYYHSQIDFKLISADVLQAQVTLGQPVHLAGLDIDILGEAADDTAFSRLDTQAQVGDRLNHEKYDDYKNALTRLATQRGYFDAHFELSQLQVMPSTHQAWWKLDFNSGSRYQYGTFTFLHSPIRDEYLRNIMSISPGEPYLLDELSKLTNDYTSSGWFSSVLLQPKIDEQQKKVDFDVLLYPRKKNRMEVGVGYSSDVGPRLQLGWKKPWINSRGQSFSSNLYVSAPKQTWEASYLIPLRKNPLNYYYELLGGIENEKDSSVDTQSLAVTFGALRYWNNPTGWQYSLGVRTRYDRFTQGDFEDKTFLLYPTASVGRTRLKGGMFPTWGDSYNLTANVAHKSALSDVNFFSVRGSVAWIRTYFDNHRVVLRGEIGYLRTADIQRIPPTLRFFAGGDRSVRGYGYKKISPQINGKYVGASRLATGSFEYQYQIYPSWWAAAFGDSGLAANAFNIEKLHYGAGVGVRWASPIGAIKLDIATPIRDKQNNKNIQFYIGLGSEL